MGLYLSLLQSEWVELMRSKISALIVKAGDFRSLSFSEDVEMFKSSSCNHRESHTITCTSSLKESLSFRAWDHSKSKLETNDSFRNQDNESEAMKVCPAEQTGYDTDLQLNLANSLLLSPRPTNELDAAAVKLQKVYKSYRTRRNLADCAVVVEELWWNALDSASLKHSSISFFNNGKPETAASRWARARTKAAKVGKGLLKNKRAQNLALQHWLEAIDPRHRYGHNLHLYYDVWFKSESNQPFFYWLDVGDGKELSLTMCPRSKLQQDCVRYLGPKERQAYEVIFEDGKLVYKQSGQSVDTTEGSKWIFVQSTTRALYVGKKKKGSFQHSSFLAGGATIAAGRLVVKDGILKAVWPYSGHYRPTAENFKEFINFLRENQVDLTDVKRGPIGDAEECSSLKRNGSMTDVDKATEASDESTTQEAGNTSDGEAEEVQSCPAAQSHEGSSAENSDSSVSLGRRKWTTGAGPRIRCVRNYPTDLQFKALEHVNLSPRYPISPVGNCSPIPSPRPNPAMRLSPTLAGIALPARAVSLSLPQRRPR